MGDVKKGKTGSKYLYYLLVIVIAEYEAKLQGNKKELKRAKDDLDNLKDLDNIYKEIYNRGYKPQYAKKLEKYELAPRI